MNRIIEISFTVFILFGMILSSFAQKEINTNSEIKKDSLEYDNDLGVFMISKPYSYSYYYSDQEPVMIKIMNYGNNTQTDFDVSFSLNGADPVYETIDTIIEPNGFISYTFEETVDLTVPNDYVIEACVHLSYDENPENNCLTKIIYWPTEYCMAYTNYYDEWIANVLCGEINNSSDWQNLISDYTDISTTVLPGDSVEIVVTNGSPYDEDYVFVWIDWNNDFNFNIDESEEYQLVNIGGVGKFFKGYIKVPENIDFGTYRIRIRLVYYSTPFPCSSSLYGEIEDYTIIVGENNSLNPPQNITAELFNGNDLYLKWDAPESNNETELLSYNIYRNSYIVGNTTEEEFYVYNLFPSTHLFYITALYEEGESGPSNCEVLVNVIPVPRNPTATVFNDVNVNIECDPLTYTPTHYNYYRDNELIGTNTEPEYNDLLLSPGNYEYFITAQYGDDQSLYDSILYVEILPPPPPPVLSIEYQEPNIGLTWDAWTYGIDTSLYNIYYSYEGGMWQLMEVVYDTVYYDNPENSGLHCYMISVLNAWPDPVISNEACEIISSMMEIKIHDILIFPNPAKDILNISSPEKIESLEIFNGNGLCVFNKNPQKLELQISISDFSSGLYWIMLKTENQVFTKKVIIK
jgi:hypothetical protein